MTTDYAYLHLRRKDYYARVHLMADMPMRIVPSMPKKDTDAPQDFQVALQQLQAKLKTNQEGVARELGDGIDQSQVSRWMRGTEPKISHYRRIMAAAERHKGHISSEAVANSLNSGKRVKKTVKLMGYVGAGSEAHFYALADEDIEEVPAPRDATDHTVAVEVKGTSLGPALEKWLVYYDDVRSPVTEDLIGRLCVVALHDDRILVKRLKRVSRDKFDLLSNGSEDAILGVRLKWAARVTEIRPRP